MTAMEKSWEHLQPFRIPGGWTIGFNNFDALDPGALSPDDRRWQFFFVEDILYMYTDHRRRRNKREEVQRVGIDLGWYPDGDPAGSFRLEAILDDDWVNPLLTFTSRSRQEIVDTLEMWLFREFMPNYFIEEAVFRRNHRKKT